MIRKVAVIIFYVVVFIVLFIIFGTISAAINDSEEMSIFSVFILALGISGGTYFWRHQIHIAKGIFLKSSDVPTDWVKNKHEIDLTRRVINAFSADRYKAICKRFLKTINIGKPKFLSPEPQTFLKNEEVAGAFVRFLAKHTDDFVDEISDGQLDWNNEQCAMFFRLMESRYNISQKNVIASVLYIELESSYFTYQDAMQAKNPQTFENLMHETVIFDIYQNSRTENEHIQRYANENSISPSIVRRIDELYNNNKEQLKVRAFERNLQDEVKSSKGSLEDQIRQETREQYFSLTDVYELSIKLEDYVITGSNYSRDSRVDRFYKKHMSYVLATKFDSKCCNCGDGMSALEFDHFWLPKSEGGNFAMLSKQGHYVNNCIPLCRRCNASKGAKSFLEFFRQDQWEDIVKRSQSMNSYINSHMIDFENDNSPEISSGNS